MRSFILLVVAVLYGQNTWCQLAFDRLIDLGDVGSVYEIKGDIVIRNNGLKKAYLLRADAEPGIRIYTSKKTLGANDTCLLTISFLPQAKGTFEKTIHLVTSDRGEPYQIRLQGKVQEVLRDNKMACYYFGQRRTSPIATKTETLLPAPQTARRDVSNRMPDASQAATSPPAPRQTEPEPVPTSTFSIREYRPNNIVFLVDVSGSMKDSLKLPLMKTALEHLVKQIRNEDRISFITYADTVKVLQEAGSAADKEELLSAVASLKARGLTKGKKAIFIAQALAQKNYIMGGNNELIIATDGKFRFDKEDENLFLGRQGEKPVVVTTVAFGNEKEALANLKDIAKKGKGSFVHVNRKEGAQQKIFDEILSRSRINDR